MNDFIPVNEPLLDGNEKKYLNECIDSGWISSEGPFVEKFENDFSEKVGRKYGIAVSNGTVALDVALAALKVGSGDEVIVPSFTIISCITAIIRAGAKPVLIDSNCMTWNMAVEQIEEKITSRTKAIMVVHIYGLPVDMNPVVSLAKKYGLKIIEDAAEMHGQTYFDKPCGSFGEISTFSFYPNKHVTTGEGGMVVTDDVFLAERCRSLRNLCFQKKKRFYHEDLGWNFRMSNLQAALGVAQIERLDEFILRKREMGKLYNSLLNGVPGIQLPLPKTEYADNIYWVYGILLKDDVQVKLQYIMDKLTQLGIGNRPFFWPVHKQPVFEKMKMFSREEYPCAEKLSTRGFYIPSGIALSKEQILCVTQTLKRVLNECI